MRGVLERLQTTPGQEKAIVAAVDEARETMRSLRGEADLSRQDLARAFTASSFDAELLGHTFARHDEAIETARKAAIGALAKIHDALDERQRAELADLVAKGPRFGFHPYR